MKEPKDKASELVEKMDGNIEHAKIAVDEIINDIPTYLGDLNPKRFYWQQVRLELDKL